MTSNIDDKSLIERFKGGDISAFEDIVSRYSEDVATLANRILGWPGDVEDITQDIFLAVYTGLKKFRCDCSIKSWLFTITINKCRSYQYKRMLRLRKLLKIPNGQLKEQHAPADKRSLDNETFEHVRRSIKSLPGKYSGPLILKYLQELPTNQICEILGITNNTLQVRLHRCRKILKDQLIELAE